MKERPKITRLREQIMPILQSRGVTRAGVFDSYARGTDRKTSDVDLLVDFPSKGGLFAFVGLKRALEKKLKRSVDLVEYGAIKPRIKKEIMRDHVPLV